MERAFGLVGEFSGVESLGCESLNLSHRATAHRVVGT